MDRKQNPEGGIDSTKTGPLYEAWREETGSKPLPLGGLYHRDRQLWQFVLADISAEEVRTVVRYLKKLVQLGKRDGGCLRFQNVFGPRYADSESTYDAAVEWFLGDLSSARNFRGPPDAREKALNAIGRTAEKPREVAQPREKLAEFFGDLGNKLKGTK